MPKNENGCPCMANTPRMNGNILQGTAQNENGNNTNGMRPREGCSGGGANGTEGIMGRSCGGTGDCLDTMPLAYVYSPDQKFCMLYSAADALRHGTLFEQLYKPMEVYGNE